MKPYLIIHGAKARKKLVSNTKLVLNIIYYVLDNYLINRMEGDSIHNDLGASFTRITRKKNRILKEALPEGEEKLRNEIEWILQFKDTSFSRFLPRIYRSSTKAGHVFYEMQYYNFPNLRRILLNEMNAPFFIKYRLLNILDILRTELWIEGNSAPCPDNFMEVEHFGKFKKRRETAISMAPFLSIFYEAPLLHINGKDYLNAEPILETLQSDPGIVQGLTPDKLYYSHGDVHSNNILCGIRSTKMVFIDCRGKSSTGTMYYDPAYDIGKIFHDFNSLYSLIEKHHYSLFSFVDGDCVSIEFSFLNPRGVEVFHTYNDFLRSTIEGEYKVYGNILERADFTEAMLYLTMIPMHLRLKDEALMCYATGVLRLNEWLAKYHPERYKVLAASHPSVLAGGSR